MKTGKNRLKGSVLFTVVSVMALLIIFLISTLMLSTAASRRSHANYSQSQAEYTARTAIESFTQAMQNNAAIAQEVASMSKTAVIEPTVVINEPGMGEVGYYDDSNNWVPNKIRVKYVDDTYVPTEAGDWEAQQMLQILVTAKVGKEERTAAYYIRRKMPNEPTPLSIKGFQTVGMSRISTTGSYITGAYCVGIMDDVNGVHQTYKLNNGDVLGTDIAFINGDLDVAGSDIRFELTKTDTGVAVMGDVDIQNDFNILVDYPYATRADATKSWLKVDMTQKNIPYLYIDGTLNTTGGTMFSVIGGRDTQTELRSRAPFNIFAGKADIQKGMNIATGDMYLMDDSGTSTIRSGVDSSLYAWSESIANQTDTQFGSKGGNIYCNHDLEITGGNGLEVYGDIRVNGDLTLHSKVKVHGDVIVDGELKGISDVNNIAGNVYCKNPEAFTGNANSIRTDIYPRANNYVTTGIKPGYVMVKNYQITKTEYPNIQKENFTQPNWAVVMINNVKYTIQLQKTENSLYDGPSEKVLYYNFNQTSYWPVAEYKVTKEVNGTTTELTLSGDDADEFSQQWNANMYQNPDEGWRFEMCAISIPKTDADGNPVTDDDGNQVYETYYGKDLYVDADGNFTGTKYSYVLTDPSGNVMNYESNSELNIEKIYYSDSNGQPTTDEVPADNSYKPGGVWADYAFYSTFKVNPDNFVLNERTLDQYTYWLVKADGTGQAARDDDGNYIETDTSVVSAWSTTATVPTELENSPDLFIRADVSGIKMNEVAENITDELYTYWDTSDTATWVDEDDAVDPDSYYYTAWFNPGITVTDPVFYYDEDPTDHTGDPSWLAAHQLTGDDILSTNDKVGNVSNWKAVYGEVYPSNMEKEEINGSNGLANKIIKTADEIRTSVGVPFTQNYITTVPDGEYEELTINSSPVPYNITKNTILRAGTISDPGAVINIDPQGGELWIILDGSTNGPFATGNCYNNRIVVSNNGTVNFFIKGEVTLETMSILTKNIYDQIAGGTGNVVIRESDNININYYGDAGSLFKVYNETLICGVAKCPFTNYMFNTTYHISGGQSGHAYAKSGNSARNFVYIDNDGNRTTHEGVSWIGNALFNEYGGEGDGGSNNFTMLYTETGASQNTITNDITKASWVGLYYDMY